MRTPDGPHRLDVAIGHRIRERRRRLSMSQQMLGEALGVSFQQVQKYERGANRVSFSRLVEMAGALRCQVSDLAEGLEPDRRPQEIEQVNGLMELDGALNLLEAYAALGSDALRRAVLQHVRALAMLEADPGAPADASTPKRR